MRWKEVYYKISDKLYKGDTFSFNYFIGLIYNNSRSSLKYSINSDCSNESIPYSHDPNSHMAVPVSFELDDILKKLRIYLN